MDFYEENLTGKLKTLDNFWVLEYRVHVRRQISFFKTSNDDDLSTKSDNSYRTEHIIYISGKEKWKIKISKFKVSI